MTLWPALERVDRQITPRVGDAAVNEAQNTLLQKRPVLPGRLAKDGANPKSGWKLVDAPLLDKLNQRNGLATSLNLPTCVPQQRRIVLVDSLGYRIKRRYIAVYVNLLVSHANLAKLNELL